MALISGTRYDIMTDLACVLSTSSSLSRIRRITLTFRFGGGSEMIRDGEDADGLWHLLEAGQK